MGVVTVKLFGDEVIPIAKFGIPAPDAEIRTAQTGGNFTNKVTIGDGGTVGSRNKPALLLALAVSRTKDFVAGKHLPARYLIGRLDLPQGDINEVIFEQ